jgi:hypothetical protein
MVACLARTAGQTLFAQRRRRGRIEFCSDATDATREQDYLNGATIRLEGGLRMRLR